jgi:hypothetical protein
MKKILNVIFGIITFFALTAGVEKSAGPPGCHANEPPNNTNCTSCHTGVINQGTAQVDLNLNGAEVSYIPGQTYTFTVSVKKTGMQDAGFQFIALQNNNNAVSPGTITLIDPTRTQKVDISNPHLQGCSLLQRVWVEHTFQGITSNMQGESIWSFQWKAPETNVGAITFYLAALETNSNGDETGDLAYTRSITSSAVVNTSEEAELLKNSTLVYINKNKLHIDSDLSTIENITISDIHGKELNKQSLFLNDKNKLTMDVDELARGLYIVIIKSKQSLVVKKIFKFE